MSAPEGPDGRPRCNWCLGSSEAMLAYHDEEWGVPERDDRKLWAKLILDGAQAGLSWSTILHRREGYYRAFADLDPERVARFGDDDVERLMADPGIIRNRLKIRSTITNARAYLELQEKEGSFSDYLWGFVDGRPVVHHWTEQSQVPAETDLSRALSKDLKKRGFRFVGPVIVYAYLQAVGLVNDHLTGCFRHGEVGTASPPTR